MTPAEYGAIPWRKELAPFHPDWLTEHAPDEHWVLINRTGVDSSGRLSLWWRDTPPYRKQHVGFIGHFAARDAASAATLLEHACQRLTEQGCTLAVGPLDGTTWRSYRLLTERGPEPRFFLEPDNPDDWPTHFVRAGLLPLAGYYSALNPRLSPADPRLPALARAAANRGVALRPIALDDFDVELRRVYALCAREFQQNLFYSPISQADFLAQYTPIRPHLRPDLILLAECDGELVGFLFALPDLLQAQRGQTVDTVILKTMAVAGELRNCGLGTLLIARAQADAAVAGFRRSIFALMSEDNASRRISEHYATTMRRYVLFGRELGR